LKTKACFSFFIVWYTSHGHKRQTSCELIHEPVSDIHPVSMYEAGLYTVLWLINSYFIISSKCWMNR